MRSLIVTPAVIACAAAEATPSPTRRTRHWKLTGVGHAWPGGAQGRLEGMFVGRRTRILDADAEMWRFFERFTTGEGTW